MSLQKIEVPKKESIVDFLRKVVAEGTEGEFFVYPGITATNNIASVAGKYSKALGAKFSVRKFDGKIVVGIKEKF